MGWLKHKKKIGAALDKAGDFLEDVSEVSGFAARFIFNNLLGLWEVYDKGRGVLDHLEDSAGDIIDIADVEREKLSRDFNDAEEYVRRGVSEASDVWFEIKKRF